MFDALSFLFGELSYQELEQIWDSVPRILLDYFPELRNVFIRELPIYSQFKAI